MSDNKTTKYTAIADEMTPAVLNGSLVADIKAIIEQGKRQAYMSINSAMIETYWKFAARRK